LIDKRNLNILTVAWYFHPEGGGAENYIYNITKGLVKRGHKVTVLCSSRERRNTEELIDGIQVIRSRPELAISTTPIKFDLFFKLLKVVKEGTFDIMFVNSGLPYYPDVATLASRTRKIPSILVYHNDIYRDSFPLNLVLGIYNHCINRLTLHLTNKIVVASPYCYNESRFLGGFKSKLTWIPPGVAIEKYESKNSFRIHDAYGLSHSATVVLFTGQISKAHKHKGITHLINSFPGVLQSVGEAYLVLVGKGDMIPGYKEMVRVLGISDRVIFPGFLDENELIEYYQSSNVVVLPSTTVQEGFGMTLLEGSACGKPVVASAVGGMKYLVEDGVDGLTVPPKDEKALANAIISILDNEKMANDMGAAGRKKAEQYDWEILTSKVEAVFKEVIDLSSSTTR